MCSELLSRVVTRSPRFSHSVWLLKSLHWLPLQYRIIFKLCTIVYQTLSSGEPPYLFSSLLALKPRELRLSGFHLMSVLRVKIDGSTHAFFSCYLHSLELTPWTRYKSSNSIVSFRPHLKTHFFRLGYPSWVSIPSDHLLVNLALYLDYEFVQPLYYRCATELDYFLHWRYKSL